MLGRRHHQIVEDKAVSLDCNPILRVPASFPRTGGRGGEVGCLVGGEAVAATCFSQQEASSGTGLLDDK